MSHELRTPLHGILSYAGFGLREGHTADRDELIGFFQTIDESGRLLLGLLNDLLDLAKLESGRMPYEFESHDLCLLVSAAVDEFHSRCIERDLEIDWQAPPLLIGVCADETRMMQVLRNLLSNAVKFSPAGGTVTVRVETVDKAVRVTISDEGDGIPEDELEAIFDKFVQSTKTRSGAGGTGLGLAICREIVVAHAGHVWAENGREKGAIFAVELPVESVVPAASDASIQAP
jgi:signal transduction histidine kinase